MDDSVAIYSLSLMKGVDNMEFILCYILTV